jgi:hypothetical protein
MAFIFRDVAATTTPQLRPAPKVIMHMRRLARPAVVMALLLIGASVADGAARHHRTSPRCSPGSSPHRSASQPYRQTIAVDPYAQVYSLGGGPPVKPPPPGYPRTEEWERKIYGCVYGHWGAYFLGVEPRHQVTKYMNESYFGDLNLVLAGPIVAYERFSIGEDLGAVRLGVAVQDLRTGRTLRDEPTGKARIPGSEPELEFGIGHTTAIVVKSDGSVAWIVKTSASEGRDQVHAVDTTGSRVLASGSDIDPTSLALAGSTLYWTQGGKPFSAPLN